MAAPTSFKHRAPASDPRLTDLRPRTVGFLKALPAAVLLPTAFRRALPGNPRTLRCPRQRSLFRAYVRHRISEGPGQGKGNGPLPLQPHPQTQPNPTGEGTTLKPDI